MDPIFHKPIIIPRAKHMNVKVEDLIDLGSRTWSEERLHEYMWQVDIPMIMSIPLSMESKGDSFVWHHDWLGEYTVKSGYQLSQMTELSSSTPTSTTF